MIAERAGAALLATGAAATATMPTPVVGHFLGYPFEAASMIAGLFAAIVTRIIINTRNRSTGTTLDLAVLALVLLTTGTVVAALRTNLLEGLLYGTGIAVTGEGLLRIAEKWVNKGLTFFDVATPAPPPAPTVTPVQQPSASDDGARIAGALRDLNEID